MPVARLTLRCTRLATAGFARLRERVNSNVRPPPMEDQVSGQSASLCQLLLSTAAGRLCVLGAALQVPMVLFLAYAVYRTFPYSPSEELAGLAFMHMCVIAALFASWFYYGLRLGFRKTTLLNVLLVLIAVAPFFPSYAQLAAA